MSEIADAITGTAADMFGGAPGGETEDTTDVVAAPEAEVAPDPLEPTADTAWDFEAAGRDLFASDPEDVPDFDALAEAELGTAETAEDVLAPSDYDDDATRQLKKQLLAEKKKAEYHQRQHLTAARKTWEADVKGQDWAKFLPQDLSVIKGSSHRDFLREAKAVARTNYEVLKPHYERLAAERAALHAQTVQDARTEAAAAWGKPTVGGAQIPAAAEQPNRGRLDAAIKSRDMVSVVKSMIDDNLI